MYEHCFRNLRSEMKSKQRESRVSLVGFSGEVIVPPQSFGTLEELLLGLPWLRFDRCVLDCDLLEMFLAVICLKHSWLRFARYALDTMADMTAPTGQAPTMAPPIAPRFCYSGTRLDSGPDISFDIPAFLKCVSGLARGILAEVKDIKENDKIEAKTGQNQEQTEKRGKVNQVKAKVKVKPIKTGHGFGKSTKN
nr:hypothetical protein [Tanacetum cinerariifolium]